MEQNLKQVNNYIHRFKEVLNSQNQLPDAGKLKVGVDLGTANIVIAVLTENNKPIAGSLSQASVIRDGLVVDFVGAVEIVRQLKTKLEGDLGLSITDAATAVLPGTISGNWKVFQNVLESADINVTNILDEPTAAASALGIKDGAVVDIGGGTTGVSILENGDVIYTGDEPTGGTHMTLVLSGYYNISIEKAERLKDKTKEKIFFQSFNLLLKNGNDYKKTSSRV